MSELQEIFRITTVPPDRLENARKISILRLTELLPNAQICEVGSTAIEGVFGKSDLDIVVKVCKSGFAEARAILDKVFPRNQKQFSSEDYQGYIVPSEMDVAIQLIIDGGLYDNFETFLTELRKSAALKKEYNELKKSWNGKPMIGYRDAKRLFIEKVIAGATKRPES